MSSRLFLIDGMAMLYRSHFAFINNPLRDSSGRNVSALFGFLSTIQSVCLQGNPTHLAVALDSSEPTPRHIAYPPYKANRQAMPEDLAAQIPLVPDLLAALHIPLLRVPGFEADDIIGTLATQTRDLPDFQTYMVTPDKDYCQLVSPTTFIWKPGRKGSEHEILDPAAVCQQWEIPSPDRVVDVLALMGDASDNIPGIPGFGEKTAKKLVATYGSLEKLIQSQALLKGRQRELVAKHAEMARLSRQLVTIITDAPIHSTLDDMRLFHPDWPAFDNLCQQLGFRTLERRFREISWQGDSPTPPAPDTTQAAPEPQISPFSLATPPTPATTPPASKATPAAKPAPSSEFLPSESQDDLFPSLQTLADIPHTYVTLTTSAQRRELASLLAASPLWAFDTETTGLDESTCQLLGVSFALPSEPGKPTQAWFVPVAPGRSASDRADLLADLAPAFQSPATKVGHNLKYDLLVLQFHGATVHGPFEDTMLMHALLEPASRHGMDALAVSLLNYQTIHLADIASQAAELATASLPGIDSDPLPDDETGESAETREAPASSGKKTKAVKPAKSPKASKNLDISAIPVDILAEYAAEDADVTLRLFANLEPKLVAAGLDQVYRDIELPLLPTLVNMEFAGVRIDPVLLADASATIATEIEALRESVIAAAGHDFNLNSPKQIGEVLFSELQLLDKPKKTKTGQFVTDEETLSTLAPKFPIVADLLAYREASKLKGTYLDALPRHISPRDGRVHTRFQQLATHTGRLASQDPNLQNIPVRTPAGREIRKAFVPASPDNLLVSADYSQIELRIMAAISGDANMIDAFRHNRDIHRETAAALYSIPLDEVTDDMRRSAKTVNFSIIYGISAFGLASRLGISRAMAADFISGYFKLYPGVKQWLDATITQAREDGFVSTLSGRKRFLPDINSRNPTIRAASERYAINSPVQGTAADMVKLAMTSVDHYLSRHFPAARLILQIHDELVIDAPADDCPAIIEATTRLMASALPLPHDVPVLVEANAAANWAAAH